MLSLNCYFCSLIYSVSFSLNSTLKSQKDFEEIDNLEKTHKIKRLGCFQMENFLPDLSYSDSKFRHASNSKFRALLQKLLITDTQLQLLSFQTNVEIQLGEFIAIWSNQSNEGELLWMILAPLQHPISSTFHQRGLHVVEDDAIHRSDIFHFPQPHSPETQFHGFGQVDNKPCSLS